VHPARCYEFGPDDLARVARRLGDGVRATTSTARRASTFCRCARALAAGWRRRRPRCRRVHRLLSCHFSTGRGASSGARRWSYGTGDLMDVMDGRDMAERFARAWQRIERAGGDPERITLIAVTKGFGPEVVAQARALGTGLRRELRDRPAAQGGGHRPRIGVAESVRWHYLGASSAPPHASWGPSSTSGRASTGWGAGERIAQAHGARLLVQVNVSGEPASRAALRRRARPGRGPAGARLDVRGLMAVGPAGPPEDAAPVPAPGRAGG